MGTYLSAIDLVTQNQLTIIARYGVDTADRMLGDVNPGQATITVNNSSTTARQVGALVATEFNVTKSLNLSDNMGGSQRFSTGPALNFYSNPSSGYTTFNQQVGSNFGTISLTSTNFSSQLFNTPGTYSWTVPVGVTSISVAGIGGGGGGSQKSAGGSGGGGGLITYSNSIEVTPGTTCTIVVGSGGATGGNYGINGGSTYLLLPDTNVPIVIAQGGAGGDSIFWLSSSIGISYMDVTGTITTQAAYDPAGNVITYSVSAGSLPTGASLNTSTGAISWTGQSLSADTEYTPFTLSASNGSQTITKQFTLKILRFVLTIDYLIVGGGGGAGYDVGGGGGGGGLVVGTAFAVAVGSTAIAFTIGQGGISNQDASKQGANGSATTATFSGSSGSGSVVAPGGGGGGSHTASWNTTPLLYGSGLSGGSGGGGGTAGSNPGGSSTQASYSSFNGVGYGYAGGTSYSSQWGSGGGGGAGGAGATGTGGFVTGGTPYTSSISGSSVNYSGGGYGNSDAGAIYVTGNNSSNVAQGYYGYGANGSGSPNASSYNGNPGIAIVRYLGSTQFATGGTTSTSGGYFIHTFTSTGTLTF